MSASSLFRHHAAPTADTDRGDLGVVILTADPSLAERLSRVAAAIGLGAETRLPTDQPTAARLIVADAEQLVALAERGPLRAAPILAVAAGEMTVDQWRAGLSLGVRGVHDLTEPDEVLVRLAADLAVLPDSAAGSAGRIVTVLGACGGAGASSMAVALGLAAQHRGETAVLGDTDRFGAGLEVTVGLEQPARLCWGDIDVAGGRLAPGALEDALPRLPGGPGRLLLMGFGEGPREAIRPGVVAAVLGAIRDSGQLGIVDLSRSFDDAALAAVDHSDMTVIITPAEVRGCFGAVRAARRLAGTRLALVVRGPSPSGLTAAEIAEAAEIPLITSMRPQPRLDYDVDIGRGPGRRRGPLTVAAGAVLDYLRGN